MISHKSRFVFRFVNISDKGSRGKRRDSTRHEHTRDEEEATPQEIDQIVGEQAQFEMEDHIVESKDPKVDHRGSSY